MIKFLFYNFVTVNSQQSTVNSQQSTVNSQQSTLILNFIWNYVYYIYLIKLSLIRLFSKLFSTQLRNLLTIQSDIYLNFYINLYLAKITALTRLYSNIYFKTRRLL